MQSTTLTQADYRVYSAILSTKDKMVCGFIAAINPQEATKRFLEENLDWSSGERISVSEMTDEDIGALQVSLDGNNSPDSKLDRTTLINLLFSQEEPETTKQDAVLAFLYEVPQHV